MNEPIMRKRGIYSVIVSVIVVGVTTFACLLIIDRMQFGNSLQGRYNKELYDLIGNIQNIDSDLSKVEITSSYEQSVLLFSEIWRQAASAADKVNSLPVEHSAISDTSKFLSQLSDFSYALLKIETNDEKLSDEEMKNLNVLKDNALKLTDSLYSLQKEIEEGKMKWTDITYKGGKIFENAQTNLINQKFSEMNKQVEKYPVLIYDGPFSENVLNIEPRILKQNEITQDEAKEKITKLFGSDKINSIESYSEKEEGQIPSYPFKVKLNNSDKKSEIYMDISKNGGYIIYMLNTRAVSQPKLDIEDAIDKGLKYLNSLGYKDMIPSFSQRNDNILTINYVFVKRSEKTNIVVYPDQVNVKIALDDGEIIGLESKKYLVAHTERNIASPKISLDEAKSKISQNINIKAVRLAVIPLLSMKEIFCYEFIGVKDDKKFIIYINAENGNEENILQIIDTEGGELAM